MVSCCVKQTNNTVDNKTVFAKLSNPVLNSRVLVMASNILQTFLGLSDTPSSYDGAAGKVPIVKTTEDGLDFALAYLTDEQIKISSNDTTRNYLYNKLVAGNDITISVNNEGENETITISSTAQPVGNYFNKTTDDTNDITDTATNRFTNDTDITRLANTSGTNTGDVSVLDSSEIDFTLTGQQITASIKSGSIDETKLDTSVNSSLDLADTAIQTESDPVFSNSEAANITATDITNLSNLSGTNSGDQSSSDFSLEDLSDVDKTGKAEGKILKVNSEGNHVYVTDESGTDEKVKYDVNDPTASYVSDKIIAGEGISVSEGTGVNENKLVVTNSDKGSSVVVPVEGDFDIKNLGDSTNLRITWSAKQDALTAGVDYEVPLTFSTGLTRTLNVITCDITQYVDADAVSAIKADASWNALNWDSAYGWGNHALAGYVTGTPWTSEGYLTNIESESIADLSDVDTLTGITDGKILKWNINKFVLADDDNTTYSASDFDLKDLTDSTGLKNSWDAKYDSTNFVAGTDYEDALGNPASDDYVLSSKTDGTRSWVEMSGGGGDFPLVSKSINTWCLPGWYSGGATNGTPGNHIAYIPIFVSETTTYDRVGAYVAGTGSAGALVRFGLYNFANGVATTLITDYGTIDVTTSGSKEIVINTTLDRGWYAIAMISNGRGGVLSSMDMAKTRPPVAEGTTSALNTAPQYVLGIALNQTAQCTNGLNATASTITHARDSSMACAKLRKV